MKISLYFRVQGLAINEEGKPAPAGLIMTWDVSEGAVIPPYDVLAEHVDKAAVLALALPGDRFREEDIEVITPEEYEREFGND